MSIIVITIPDARKQQFVAKLQHETAGAVSLVVLQERQRPTWRQRWQYWRRASLWQIVQGVWYGCLLRLHKGTRSLLQVFHAPLPTGDIGWAAPVVRVSSVNDPIVRQAIKEAKPAVAAVWGSGMLHDTTLAEVPIALNVHLGISSKYRGAYANQCAVERGDWQNIGATIHHINQRADAGAVIKTMRANLQSTPEATFAALHTQVETDFVNILQATLQGEIPAATTPDVSRSINLRLADWTPVRRFAVAAQLRRWPVVKPVANPSQSRKATPAFGQSLH